MLLIKRPNAYFLTLNSLVKSNKELSLSTINTHSSRIMSNTFNLTTNVSLILTSAILAFDFSIIIILTELHNHIIENEDFVVLTAIIISS